MRKAYLVKQTISSVLALSMSAAMAAGNVDAKKHASIDNEIQAMAVSAKSNSQVRVETAKARKEKTLAAKKAKEAQRAEAARIANARKQERAFSKRANPASAAVATDTTAFDEFDDFEKAPSTSTATSMATATTTASVRNVKPEEKKSMINGSVAMTVGQDSNANGDKASTTEAPVTKGSFFEITPKVGFKGEVMSGNFGARVKDFTNQQLSDVAKGTVINADLAADYAMGLIKGTTKLDFENNDSTSPDYLNGTNKGMPIRYFQTRIAQSLNWDLSGLSLAAGASFANKDYTTPYLDNPADHVFGQNIFEQDQYITEGTLRVGAKLADTFEIAIRPLVQHKKYSKEPARQTDGTKGGAYFNSSTPRREVIKQEGNLDLVLKTDRVNITPTLTFGNESDEAFGALDNTYQGGGIAAELIIDPATSLKLLGGFTYKEIQYDNWTNNGFNNPLPNGEKRKESEKSITAGASVNLNKNIGVAVNYTLNQEVSNLTADDENYKQEIIGSTLNVSF